MTMTIEEIDKLRHICTENKNDPEMLVAYLNSVYLYVYSLATAIEEQGRQIEAIEKRQIELVDILNTYPDIFATKKQLKPKKARGK